MLYGLKCLGLIFLIPIAIFGGMAIWIGIPLGIVFGVALGMKSLLVDFGLPVTAGTVIGVAAGMFFMLAYRGACLHGQRQMRARAKVSYSPIAIHAKNTKPKRIIISLQPVVNLASSSLVPHDFTTMFITSTINMVDRKELRLCYTTTGANRTSIGMERRHFNCMAVFKIIRTNFIRVLLSPNTGVFPTFFTMCLCVLSKHFFDSFWMFISILPGTLPIICSFCLQISVWHNKTASLQLAAPTQRAGWRQLE